MRQYSALCSITAESVLRTLWYLVFASVGADHAPPALRTPRGIRQLAKPTLCWLGRQRPLGSLLAGIKIAVCRQQLSVGSPFRRPSVEGVHAVVMIMEAEPPPWHVAGEAGGVIGEEATLRRQSLRGVAAGVLQQELPEPLEDIPVFRCGGKVMPLHGIPVQVEQQGVAACGGVDQLLLPLHDAEIPVQAIAEEDSVFRQVRYRQQVPTGAPLRAVLPRHGQDRGVDVRQVSTL